MKNSFITVTDQFCGAGGSSQGVRNFARSQNGGIEVKLALNHWKRAIETHNANFPDTDHDCTDISACDPRKYRSTDILITSPECTNHSIAKGKKRKYLAQLDAFGKVEIKPEEERSRATMWDVPRFAEYHDYNIIIVENVVDARMWVMWDAWLLAMFNLGYQHKCCFLNSQHFGETPQSRDRMYVVFWKKGNPKPDLNYRPLAYSPALGRDVQAAQAWKNTDRKFGKYRTQYVYRCPETGDIVEPYYHAAFNAIDWSIKGKPAANYSENTLKRIQYGLDKFQDSPFMVYLDHSKSGIKNATLLSQAARTQTTADTSGLVVPFVVDNYGTSKSSPITNPFGSQTTVSVHGVVNPENVKAFISYYYGKAQASNITDPFGTAGTVDTHALVTYKKPSIEDCTYRTIRPHEVKRIMGFDKDYIMTGNSKEQTKQLGNAVTPDTMTWLIQQTVNSLS